MLRRTKVSVCLPAFSAAELDSLLDLFGPGKVRVDPENEFRNMLKKKEVKDKGIIQEMTTNFSEVADTYHYVPRILPIRIKMLKRTIAKYKLGRLEINPWLEVLTQKPQR